jgi:hypothetical protein
MRRAVAGLLTAIIMGSILWSGIGRLPSSSLPASDPGIREPALPRVRAFDGAECRIEALLTSARQGDIAAYLSAFGGPLRARLEREAREQGQGAFARALRKAGLARKSQAIFAPEPDSAGPGAARVAVELTFADRLERQTFHLERGNSGWLITDVETARERIPTNPLGSPAKFEEPEGIPVTAGSDKPDGEAIKGQPDM